MSKPPKSTLPDSAKDNDPLSQSIWDDDALTQALLNIKRTELAPTPNDVGQHSYWVPALAACTILAVTLTFLWPNIPLTNVPSKIMQTQSIATAKSEQNEFLLEDGTQLSLAANTALEVAFSQQQRQVSFKQGEAYFDVAHNVQRPFNITTVHGNILVVGTAFNIDQDDLGLDIKVYEGVVKVTNGVGEQLQVTKGQRIFVSKTSRISDISFFDIAKKEDWMLGILNADNMRLSQIITRLNRYSDKQLYLAPGLGEYKITGTFNLRQWSESVHLLEELYDLDRVTHDGSLYLSPK